MQKYWHVIKIGFANTLVYRFNFFFRAVFGLVPLLATIYLWRAVYHGQNKDVGGYGLAGMISYYLIITIVDTLTAVAEDDWQIAADIKDGNISQFMLKPINYLGYRLCLFFSGRIMFASISILPVGMFIYWWRQYFVGPDSGAALGMFLISTVMTGLLQFFISFTLALLSFWLLEVSTIIFMFFAVEYIAGGHLFPLNILPAAVARFLDYTPFPYQLYFPAGIYLGQIKGAALARGMLIQTGWVLFFYGLSVVIWRRGIRKYSAAGG
jgi:ABC-2 type transport system permease protein